MKPAAFFMVLVLMMLPAGVMAQQLPKEGVEEFSRLVHDNMAGAMIGDGHLITEEEAQGLEYPLLPYELRQDIIIRGHLSGFAKICGLDWAGRSFEPFMDGLRAMTPKPDDYQMAFAGMLHGLSMENAVQSRKDKPCTDEEKARFETQMLK